MSDSKKDRQAKPLLYKVEPKEGEQIISQRQHEAKQEQTISQRQHKAKQEQTEVEQTPPDNKEEKIEQLKREFGVYEALAEVEREKAIANEWIKGHRKQEQVEVQPVQVQEEQRPEEKVEVQPVQVQEEQRPEEKVVPKKKKRKKKKQESVAEIITRLANVTEGPRPTCEAELFGEKTQFQVLGMRGEAVKIRIGFRVRIVKLSDISQLKVISG
jgi:hypothetical protein